MRAHLGADGSRRKARGQAPRASAELPRDAGVTPLGLLMELGGTVFLLVGAGLVTLGAVIAWGEGGATWLFALFGAASCVRSELHRRAGRALLYGHARGVGRPLRAYLAAAFGHAAIAGLVFSAAAHWAENAPPIWVGSALAAALAVWPGVIFAVLWRSPAWRAIRDLARVPGTCDRGHEALAVVMTLMGAFGVLFALTVPISGLAEGSTRHASVALPLAVVLGLRSVLHARAGLTGVRGGVGADFEDRALTYSNAAIIVAFLLAATAAFAGLASSGGSLLTIAAPLALFWALYIWPRLVGRFLADRSGIGPEASEALARAPDRGLTALGWLLLALAALALALDLLRRAELPSPAFWVDVEILALGVDLRLGWPALVALAVKFWAGAELAAMSRRWRAAAHAYAAVGVAAALWAGREQLAVLTELGYEAATPAGALPGVQAFLSLAIAFVLPIATIALARRRDPHAARLVAR